MASIINAATSGGLISTGDTSGQLQLQTAGTTALTVDSSQNVGVGTSSPTTKLQISATTPVVTVTGTGTTASSQDFTTNSAAQRTTIGVERSTGGGLFVGSSAYAAVFGSAGASSTQFATNNTVRATIDTSGNLTFNTSNAGIIFNNSSALTNSTLNDYEIGNFAPTMAFGGGSTGITYSGNRHFGRYIKIGKIVNFYIFIQLTSKGSSTGTASIEGLPFTSINNDQYVPVPCWIDSFANITSQIMPGRISNNSTTIYLFQLISSSFSFLSDTNLTNTSGIQIQGQYEASF